ncbi:DUF2283 domain-containing protein [Actinomadura darangshiensis]|uniref:DUF2283 domain-containing protein n=1 Tax=Actinomadura darangshiensis TaxID=705336 RepID=A0A4R5BTD0_9ACTN|nr:DUF2283 domain-containing protein [Actinomadura darangshiensis]TDD89335.1 DUF2283 domain-containing protein [Actinomadura darangshiensis]
MVDVKVTYDKSANAAYLYFSNHPDRAEVAHMYPCDPVEVGGMINLDFDKNGRIIGIEVLAASSKLPKWILEAAERLDVD